MLEQISQLVKQYGQDAVVNNPDVPNEQNNQVMAEATHTITGGLQNMLAGGGLQDIIAMFTQRGTSGPSNGGGISSLLNNPAVAGMISQLISKLTTKFNMSPAQASQVSNNLIPNVLQDVVSKTQSTEPEHDAFNLNNLIGSLTGGQGGSGTAGGGFDFQSLINQVSPGTNQSGAANGGFDLQDIISKVTSSAQENKTKEQEQDGGVANLIKGFFN